MKINIALASAAAALVCLTSCMQEVLPTESVISDQIGQSASALDGMVNSIYTNMVGYKNEDGGIETISYGGMRVQLEHSTTMMVCPGYNGFNTMGAWTQGAVSASGSNRGIYPTYLYYGYIKTVNDVIGMIDLGNATDEMLVDLGICYAYRALYYMDLVQIMEYKKPLDSRYVYVDPKSDLSNLGVPIVTDKTTTQEASNNPRATVDEVYDLILSDLAEAEKYLAGYTRKDKVSLTSLLSMAFSPAPTPTLRHALSVPRSTPPRLITGNLPGSMPTRLSPSPAVRLSPRLSGRIPRPVSTTATLKIHGCLPPTSILTTRQPPLTDLSYML